MEAEGRGEEGQLRHRSIPGKGNSNEMLLPPRKLRCSKASELAGAMRLAGCAMVQFQSSYFRLFMALLPSAKGRMRTVRVFAAWSLR